MLKKELVIIELKYKEIKEIDSSKKIELIGNGWCGDKKYYIETVDGKRMMRVTDIANYDFHERLYDTMKELEASDVPIPCPVGFGICNGNKNVYLLLNWCNGDNLNELMPLSSEQEQYKCGMKAGEIFHKIRSIPAPKSVGDWASVFIEGKLRAFHEFNKSDIKIEGSDAIIQYFECNKHLINNRRLCLHHGDFHAGNLIIKENGELIVIDWDNYRYGDPWNDFMEIYNAELFPHFMTGLLRGYFNGEPSAEFWPMLALYVSSAVLACVSWAVKDAPDYVATCVHNVHEVLHAFDYMKNTVPKWYIKDFST